MISRLPSVLAIWGSSMGCGTGVGTGSSSILTATLTLLMIVLGGDMDAWNAGLDGGVTSHDVEQVGGPVVGVGGPGAGCTVVVAAAAGSMGPAVV
jgi:hypothetical protein